MKWYKLLFASLVATSFWNSRAHALATTLSGTTSFGKVTVGQSSTLSYSLKNSSRSSIKLKSSWFTGNSSFSKVGGNCYFPNGTLKAGRSCSIQIRFAPLAAGLLSSQFFVDYYLGGTTTLEQVSISLNGEGVSASTTNPPVPGSWLQVVGNKILNSSGTPVILKGVNIADPQHLDTKYWERPNVTARSVANSATDQFHSKVIRLPILPGDPAYPTEGFFSTTNGWDVYYNKHIEPLVTELTGKGIYVIIDLHYVSNYDTLYSKVESFWKYMAPKFANNPFVFYEIFNEPIYPDNWSTWKTTIAQPIVNLIRTYAPNNLILVGGPYWSSHISGAANDPVIGNNIVYVGHIYSNQASSIWESRYGVVADKFPLFITEWGFELGGTEGGDITYGQALESWMRNRGLSWTVWSFDILWGPRMFNSDWTLKPGPGGMGDFVRNLLAQ